MGGLEQNRTVRKFRIVAIYINEMSALEQN